MSDEMPARIPVLVTTAHRGVFFGYISEADETEKMIRIHNCRCAIYWSGRRGFLGLASHGPEEGSRIGSEAPSVLLHDVTSVVRCTDEAVKTWKNS